MENIIIVFEKQVKSLNQTSTMAKNEEDQRKSPLYMPSSVFIMPL